MRDLFSVKHAFTSQAIDKVQQQKILKLETGFVDLAKEIVDLCPDNADRTAALRKLLNAKMECVHSITHQLQVQPPPQKAPETAKPQEAEKKNEQSK